MVMQRWKMYDADAKDACGKETLGCCAEVKDGW